MNTSLINGKIVPYEQTQKTIGPGPQEEYISRVLENRDYFNNKDAIKLSNSPQNAT